MEEAALNGIDEKLKQITLSSQAALFCDGLHPELLPYVGRHYDKTRLLLVGESHFICADTPEKEAALAQTRPQFESERWYEASTPDAGHVLIRSFTTRAVVNDHVINGKNGAGFRTYSQPTAVLRTIPGYARADFSYFAFMNFFQRPEPQKGSTLHLMEADKRVANEILPQVVNILQPEAVIFLSKKAFHAFDKASLDKMSLSASVETVSHPASYWWSRARKDGGCGRTDFQGLLRKYLDR